MIRRIIRTTSFLRSAKRFLKKHPQAVPQLAALVEAMATDLYAPQLKTHKLHGPLAGLWACSGGYDLRVVFQLTSANGDEEIVLHALGTHDQVY